MSELANNDNKLIDVHKQLEDAKRKQKELLEKQLELRDLPPTWDETRPEILVEVTPTDQEYWVVSDKLRETLPDGWISRVWRIQNRPLYNFYCFHKTRLNTTNGEATDEKHVWHGTSSLDLVQINTGVSGRTKRDVRRLAPKSKPSSNVRTGTGQPNASSTNHYARLLNPSNVGTEQRWYRVIIFFTFTSLFALLIFTILLIP